MFTGIVQHTGMVRRIEARPDGAAVSIQSSAFTSAEAKDLRIGDSVAISGVCLTVTEIRTPDSEAGFEIASETLRRTTLGRLRAGSACHIERSLRVGDSLDGHLVFGHVDGTAVLLSKALEGETTKLQLRTPPGLALYIAPKGSISLDGVSLTVGEVEPDSFFVYIIPHTLRCTHLGALSIGDEVNVEIDMIARYVVRVLDARGSSRGDHGLD